MLDQFRHDTAFILNNWRQILALNNVVVLIINLVCILAGTYGFLTLSNNWEYAALALALAGGVGIAEAIAGRVMGGQ